MSEMHPMTYRLAVVRIEDLHNEACRARLVKAARRQRRQRRNAK